jgi:hypothetical protein
MARSTKAPRPPRLPGTGPAQPQAPPLAPPDPALRQRAWAALTLGLLSVIGLFFLGNLQRGVYVVGVTVAFGMLAIWLGVTASRRARRGGMAPPGGAVGGTVFGVLGFVLSTACLAMFAVFWSQLQAYSSCMAGANTIAAQQACKSQFSNSISTEINHLNSAR